MAGYYDIVLGLIPVALLGITAALTVVGVSLTAAVPISATVAIGVIGHAMFVNGPVDSVEDAPATRPRVNSE
ncbi:hypothetical protein ACFQMM_21220 [Saliphagus sp. GCM10025308]|uniref:Uncharacterized protein n=1 Tax=Natronosalvus rutilus TaxID=2953753 RepID=A0A9E7N756_9EURY|nr:MULTISPECIES: hypothetical protein [Natronosalvus]UTF52952.1 hypothetical protein NGM29_14375 [Natronosalvus rutilus]